MTPNRQDIKLDQHPLKHSFTIFLYAFRLKKSYQEYQLFQENDSIWERSTVKPDSSYLFQHVQDFFTNNLGKTGDEIDDNQSILFSIKKDNLSDTEKEQLLLFNSLFSKKHQLIFEDEPIEFDFINDKSILSPKIIIVPLTSVGLLTFGLQLTDESNNFKNLINFNYKVRVFKAGQLTNFTTVYNPHPNAAEQEQKIAKALQSLAGNEESNTSENQHSWNIKNLTNYFLKDFEKESIETLSPNRLQAFTYAITSNKLQKEELEVALFRLRRLYSYKYHPAKSFLEKQGEIIQTFDEIHMGSSVEGAVLLLNGDHDQLPNFLQRYHDVIKSRYFWTYILAYHQRIALINAAAEVASMYSIDREPSSESLSANLSKLSRIQLKCMFNEISPYTQQNDFYYLCSETLRLPSLFEEVKEEIAEINVLLNEKWRRDDEEKRLQEEIAEKRRNNKLGILLAILIIPQIWLAILSTEVTMWQNFIDQNSVLVNIFNVIIWVVIIGIALRLYFFKRKNS